MTDQTDGTLAAATSNLQEKDKPAIEDAAFEALERDFNETISELLGDKSLEKFKVEYEKLHKSLKKSHESEKRLMLKCRELQAEIVSNSAKVATAVKISQEDQSTIASLKKEIEKAWKMVDAAYEKEQRARDTIQSLKMEIANLSKLVEQGAGLGMGTEHSVSDLLKMKEDLTKERDELLEEIVRLREANRTATDTNEALAMEREENQRKIFELNQEIQMKNNEASREERKRTTLEKQLKDTKEDITLKTTEIGKIKQQVDRLNGEQKRLQDELREQKAHSERIVKDYEILNTKHSKLQNDYELQLISADALAGENSQKVAELKAKDDEVNSLRSDVQRLSKMIENIERKRRAVEEQKTAVEGQKDELKNKIGGYERDLEAAKKQNDMDKKQVDDLTRERDMLNKQIMKAAGATQKQMNLAMLHEQAKINLEQEIANYKDEAQKQRKIIYKLEKERDRYINEASELTQKVLQHMEDVKVREMQIFDYKKKIAEAETKLKQQQNLYEAVRSDRNLYNKSLIEARDEITEMKRKLKIMNHQIDQLKEEIQSKEEALVKQNQEYKALEKEKESLVAERNKLRQKAVETKGIISNQATEQRKLLKIIADADQEHMKQKKELDQVISERDILGTQLVRRNDELALLYEKIKIQQSTLNKGEIQYKARQEDIRLLKLEIKSLRREKNILQRNVSNVDELRREVYHMQRELLRERTKCKALEEELENPMNIHRWRKLEGSDPSTYEMIQKIQSLQRRLIKKTEEVVEKELLIQEKEKLYLELKHILARQPGPEVAEQLQVYKQTLQEKTKQLKSMASELNMYESQNSDFKFEIERIAKELQDAKKKYYLQKKKEHNIKERELALQQQNKPLIQPQTRESRYAGGGFNLKQPSAVKTTPSAKQLSTMAGPTTVAWCK